MIAWIKKLWSYNYTDKAEHRLHTTKYKDLCM